MAFSFLPLISSISASIALTSGGRVIVLMRAREPASSMHVNRLVRQKPVGDVTVGQLHGRLDGLVGELGLVMLLVFVAEALQNLDGVLNGRRLDLDGLETAFQRGVLLDVFAIFVQRGRADALHLAAATARA